jgi:hypothetical protein
VLGPEIAFQVETQKHLSPFDKNGEIRWVTLRHLECFGFGKRN